MGALLFKKQSCIFFNLIFCTAIEIENVHEKTILNTN
jgi:hypothetical protein